MGSCLRQDCRALPSRSRRESAAQASRWEETRGAGQIFVPGQDEFSSLCFVWAPVPSRGARGPGDKSSSTFG